MFFKCNSLAAPIIGKLSKAILIDELQRNILNKRILSFSSPSSDCFLATFQYHLSLFPFPQGLRQQQLTTTACRYSLGTQSSQCKLNRRKSKLLLCSAKSFWKYLGVPSNLRYSIILLLYTQVKHPSLKVHIYSHSLAVYKHWFLAQNGIQVVNTNQFFTHMNWRE